MLGSTNNTWKWHFQHWRQIWLDYEQQSENIKPVLLWLDSDQESNTKDVDDFLSFPTVFTRPHMINGSGFVLYRSWWKLLDFCAGQIRGNWLFWIFDQKFEMKTQEILNTKRVDNFLCVPTNICVPCSDKQSSNYGHYKTLRGEIFYGHLETDCVFKDGRRFGLRTEPR
jgi:hypothetical protein